MFMSQRVIYSLHRTLVLSFYIDIVLTLFFYSKQTKSMLWLSVLTQTVVLFKTNYRNIMAVGYLVAWVVMSSAAAWYGMLAEDRFESFSLTKYGFNCLLYFRMTDICQISFFKQIQQMLCGNSKSHKTCSTHSMLVRLVEKTSVAVRIFGSLRESPVHGQARPILRATAFRIGRACPWTDLSSYEPDLPSLEAGRQWGQTD